MTRHIHELISRLKAAGHSLPEDLAILLAAAAAEAAEAGVTVTLSEWREMHAEERAAFAEARRAEVSRRLALLCLGLGGPGASAVAAEHDGGEASTREALERAHREAHHGSGS